METPPSANEPSKAEPLWTLRRCARIACWVVPLIALLIIFTDIGRFWWHCMLEGWEVGDHAFFFLETLCALIGIAIRIHLHRAHDEWEKKWEPTVMKCAFYFFITLFLVSTFLYVPFTEEQKAKSEIKTLGRTNAELTSRNRSLLSENARLAQQLDTESRIARSKEGEQARLGVLTATSRDLWLTLGLKSTNGIHLNKTVFDVKVTKGKLIEVSALGQREWHSLNDQAGTVEVLSDNPFLIYLLVLVSEPTTLLLSSPSLEKELTFEIK
jgi:hypothetical protein